MATACWKFVPGSMHDNVFMCPSVQPKLKFTDDRVVCDHQKPLLLCRWLVRNFTTIGDHTIDLCAGSGSFGMASLLERRNTFAIELVPERAEFIRTRFLGISSSTHLDTPHMDAHWLSDIKVSEPGGDLEVAHAWGNALDDEDAEQMTHCMGTGGIQLGAAL